MCGSAPGSRADRRGVPDVKALRQRAFAPLEWGAAVKPSDEGHRYGP